jgi:hypothetical protein
MLNFGLPSTLPPLALLQAGLPCADSSFRAQAFRLRTIVLIGALQGEHFL